MTPNVYLANRTTHSTHRTLALIIYLILVYLRPDLKLQPKSNIDESYDYFVATSRYNRDLTLFPAAKVIHSIERDGAVLTVIKQPSP